MDKEEKLKFLAQSIGRAKAVMDKADAYTKKGSAQTQTQPRPPAPQQYKKPQIAPAPQAAPAQYINESKLSKSKMPPEILDSFRKQPTLNPSSVMGLDSLVQEVKSTKHGEYTAPYQDYNQPQYIPEQQTQPQYIPEQQTQQPYNMMDPKLLEWVIKKTVEETVEQMQNNKSINENFQIKIGTKTFGGKLTRLNEVKK